MQYATLCFRDYQGKDLISGISQTQSTGTHINLSGANDWVGRSANDRVDLLAPYDCVVRAIANGDNTVFFESKEKVITPSGTDYCWFMCTHLLDSDKSILGLKVGKEFKQGQPLYTEGNKGIGSGYHIHMEQGIGRFNGTSSPYYKSSDYFIYDGKKYAQYYPCTDGKEMPIASMMFLANAELVVGKNSKKSALDYYPNFQFIPTENQDDWKSKAYQLNVELDDLKVKYSTLENELTITRTTLEEAKNKLESIRNIL